MNKPKFLFGDIVVINKNHIGVVLKTYENHISTRFGYEIYNRMTNIIETINEENIERYRVRHKYLDEEELEFQHM